MGKATAAKQESKKIKRATPMEQAEKRRNAEVADLRSIATATGLPEAQFDPAKVKRVDTRNMPGEKVIATETVRKLTRVEMLARSGLLEKHEAAACEWYADTHALAWDTIGCTVNYLGAGGGGFGSSDLLARYAEQRYAREDYALGRGFIPSVYLALFEAIVCRNETISTVAQMLHPDLKRSQALNRASRTLKLCANLLHTGIAPLLKVNEWIEAAAKRMGDIPAPKPLAEPDQPRTPVMDLLNTMLAEWQERGVAVAEIHISSPQVFALLRESGHDPESVDLTKFSGIPIVIEESWSWGIRMAAETGP